jgi:hypothetical protein
MAGIQDSDMQKIIKQARKEELDKIIRQKNWWQVISYIISAFCIFISSVSSIFSFISANVNYQILTLSSGILTIGIGFFNGFSSYVQKKIAEFSDEMTTILNIFGIKIKIDNSFTEMMTIEPLSSAVIPIPLIVAEEIAPAIIPDNIEIEMKIFKNEFENLISSKMFWKHVSDIFNMISLVISCATAIISLIASTYNQFIATIVAGALNASITLFNSIIILSKNKYSRISDEITKKSTFEI